MSALSIIQQADVVHRNTDGSTYDLEGHVLAITSKCYALEKSGCAIATRGRTITSLPAKLYDAATFGEVLELLPEIAQASIEFLEATDPEDQAEALRGFESVVAGFSEQEGYCEAYGLSTRSEEAPDIFANVADFEPFKVCLLPVLIAAPSVSLSACLGRPIASIDDVEALDAATAGRNLLEAQRLAKYAVERKMVHIVGGFGELTTVRSNGSDSNAFNHMAR